MCAPEKKKEARRDSFAAFAVDKLLAVSAKTERHEAAPSSQRVRDGTSTWERLSHATHLLGYGLCMSFFNLLFLVFLTTRQWSQPDGEGGGVPVLDDALARNGIFVPWFAAVTIY